MTRIEQEGYVEVTGGKVWYQISGEDKNTPLIYLHGGPGVPHYPFESLTKLGDERQIIFYHQLGCGKSDRPQDPNLWVLPRFVDELDKVRLFLHLDEVHILGHSWGGTLAAEYTLSHPQGIRSLILASPLLSTSRWLEDTKRLKKQLPQDMQEAIDQHERAGTTDAKEYKNASAEFDNRFRYRILPLPEQILRARQETGEVYKTMWGPSEFYCIGNLKDYDCTARLNQLTMPVLLTCGRYDEATPETVAVFTGMIPGAEIVVFENSAHHAQLTEPEKYLFEVRDFLTRIK